MELGLFKVVEPPDIDIAVPAHGAEHGGDLGVPLDVEDVVL